MRIRNRGHASREETHPVVEPTPTACRFPMRIDESWAEGRGCSRREARPGSRAKEPDPASRFVRRESPKTEPRRWTRRRMPPSRHRRRTPSSRRRRWGACGARPLPMRIRDTGSPRARPLGVRVWPRALRCVARTTAFRLLHACRPTHSTATMIRSGAIKEKRRWRVCPPMRMIRLRLTTL